MCRTSSSLRVVCGVLVTVTVGDTTKGFVELDSLIGESSISSKSKSCIFEVR